MNQSGKPVRYVEIGWMVKDKEGHEYLAGSVPGSSSAMLLPAGQHSRLLPDTTLKFSRTGKPVEIQGMTGFVSQVEFADGKVWVPSREDLKSSALLRVMAPSPEEQRLADIYSKRGLAALVAELNRYLGRVYRCTRPEPSPFKNVFTSSTVNRLKSPGSECFRHDAATANSSASCFELNFNRP